MTIAQDGVSEFIWERTPDPFKWEVKELPATDGRHSVYELRISCGSKSFVMRVFNNQEMWSLVDTISAVLQTGHNHGRQAAPHHDAQRPEGIAWNTRTDVGRDAC